MDISYEEFSKIIKDTVKDHALNVLDMDPDSFEKTYADILNEAIYTDFIKECYQNMSSLHDFVNGVRLGCFIDVLLTATRMSEYILNELDEDDSHGST